MEYFVLKYKYSETTFCTWGEIRHLVAGAKALGVMTLQCFSCHVRSVKNTVKYLVMDRHFHYHHVSKLQAVQ